MVGEDLQGAQVAGLYGAHFERCDFSGAVLSIMEDVEVIECAFDDAHLSVATWRRAQIKGCRFRGAWIGSGSFDDAVISATDWLGAYLESSKWLGAKVEGSSFRSAVLVDSRFDGATFVGCDFIYADLSRRDLTSDFARCPNTRFERCDFRGANFEGLRLNNTTFDRCLFHDMVGRPDLEGSCTLIEPDFSSSGQGRHEDPSRCPIRDPEEVLRVWKSEDRALIHHWAGNGFGGAYDPRRHFPEREQGEPGAPRTNTGEGSEGGR